MLKMDIEAGEAAIESRLETDEPIWCGFAGRAARCPPAAVQALLPKKAPDSTAVYYSGVRNDRLICGVWKLKSLPNMDKVKANHVYCIAAAPFPDSIGSILHLARSADERQPHPGAIKCAAIRHRNKQRSIENHNNVEVVNTTPKISCVNVKNLQQSEPIKPLEEPSADSIPKKNVSNNNLTQKSTKQKSNSIMGLFARQNDKPKPVKKEADEESKKTPSPVEKKNGMSSIIKQENSSDVKEEKSPSERVNSSNLGKRKPTKNKPKNSTAKKRKRIAVVESDSDNSDDIFESDSPPPLNLDFEEEEVEIPSIPVPKVVTQDTPDKTNSRKRKKDKTYMGEDGYLHTIRDVLCSDDEEEDNQKENVKDNLADCDEIPCTPKSENKSNNKNPKLPITIKTNGKEKKQINNQVKQSKIMSFFKKQ